MLASPVTSKGHWYQDVPCPLGKAFGKKRLIVSFRTRELHVVRVRRYEALAKFPCRIAAARVRKPEIPSLAPGCTSAGCLRPITPMGSVRLQGS